MNHLVSLEMFYLATCINGAVNLRNLSDIKQRIDKMSQKPLSLTIDTIGVESQIKKDDANSQYTDENVIHTNELVGNIPRTKLNPHRPSLKRWKKADFLELSHMSRNLLGTDVTFDELSDHYFTNLQDKMQSYIDNHCTLLQAHCTSIVNSGKTDEELFKSSVLFTENIKLFDQFDKLVEQMNAALLLQSYYYYFQNKEIFMLNEKKEHILTIYEKHYNNIILLKSNIARHFFFFVKHKELGIWVGNYKLYTDSQKLIKDCTKVYKMIKRFEYIVLFTVLKYIYHEH